MNIFDRMSKKALKITSRNSDGLAVYSDDSSTIETEIVVNHDVELVGEYVQTIEKINTIELTSEINVKIGGIFTMLNTYSYQVDSIISNDGAIQVVSVVKQ